MFDSSKVCCSMKKADGNFIKSNRIQIKAHTMVLVKPFATENVCII